MTVPGRDGAVEDDQPRQESVELEVVLSHLLPQLLLLVLHILDEDLDRAIRGRCLLRHPSHLALELGALSGLLLQLGAELHQLGVVPQCAQDPEDSHDENSHAQEERHAQARGSAQPFSICTALRCRRDRWRVAGLESARLAGLVSASLRHEW
eukprot:scaffold32339_cov61-Phaeocystis_antarctica.AAC.1